MQICVDGTLYIDNCHTDEHSQLIDDCRHEHCHTPTSVCEQRCIFLLYFNISELNLIM